MGQNQWYHFGVGEFTAHLEPMEVVGMGCSLGANRFGFCQPQPDTTVLKFLPSLLSGVAKREFKRFLFSYQNAKKTGLFAFW